MLIPDQSRIALDSVSLIYAVDAHLRYGTAATTVMQRVSEGALHGVAATLVLAELLVYTYRGNRSEQARALRAVLARFPYLDLVELSSAIADRAAWLRAKYTLPTPDAVHVATALEHGAEWFVTNDRRLRRVEGEGVRVWLFDENT